MCDSKVSSKLVAIHSAKKSSEAWVFDGGFPEMSEVKVGKYTLVLKRYSAVFQIT